LAEGIFASNQPYLRLRQHARYKSVVVFHPTGHILARQVDICPAEGEDLGRPSGGFGTGWPRLK
jgi:hypothetical protein